MLFFIAARFFFFFGAFFSIAFWSAAFLLWHNIQHTRKDFQWTTKGGNTKKLTEYKSVSDGRAMGKNKERKKDAKIHERISRLPLSPRYRLFAAFANSTRQAKQQQQDQAESECLARSIAVLGGVGALLWDSSPFIFAFPFWFIFAFVDYAFRFSSHVSRWRVRELIDFTACHQHLPDAREKREKILFYPTEPNSFSTRARGIARKEIG